VDAGWFLAEAAQALASRGVSSEVSCSYRDLVPALARLAVEHTGLPLLRVYWYDAASGAHEEIACLPNVKLRLGRLLAPDLTALARERAIADALVVSGDEDIREGIAAAQALGVRVTLAAVATTEGRTGLASGLIHEADDQLLVDEAFLRRSMTAVPSLDAAPVAAVPSPDEATTPREFGFRFGAAHADQLDSDDLRALQREAPMIPSEVAAQLFRDAEQVFGPIRGRPEIRRELKAGYWDHVMRRR
jgi:hypothetical protein